MPLLRFQGSGAKADHCQSEACSAVRFRNHGPGGANSGVNQQRPLRQWKVQVAQPDSFHQLPSLLFPKASHCALSLGPGETMGISRLLTVKPGQDLRFYSTGILELHGQESRFRVTALHYIVTCYLMGLEDFCYFALPSLITLIAYTEN